MVFTDFLGVTIFVRFVVVVVVDFNADFLAVTGVVLTAMVGFFLGNMAVDDDKLRSFNIH
jgi:hypothetical protein